MVLDARVLNDLTKGTAADAWRVIIDKAVEIASKPLAAGNAPSEITKRDREIGALDHFLSSSGWDLWQAFGDTVERTSDRLVRWWGKPYSAKAPFSMRMSNETNARYSVAKARHKLDLGRGSP